MKWKKKYETKIKSTDYACLMFIALYFVFVSFLFSSPLFFPLFTLNDENRFDSQIKFYGLVYSRSRLKWLIVKGIVACLFYALAKRRFNRKNESKTSTTDWSEIYSVAFFANCRCNEINIGLIRCNGRAKWKLLKYKWDAPRICKIEKEGFYAAAWLKWCIACGVC